jgi:hypothetical protein
MTALTFYVYIYWGDGIEAKAALTAISLANSNTLISIDIQTIYAIR